MITTMTTTCDKCGQVNPADIHTCTPKRPPNCGTGHCSCIECVMEKPASPVQESCFNGLIDTDGENKAVRALLMLYGEPGLTVGKMKKHLSMSGFKMWPAWVEQEHEWAHLTKAGAQLWIRHLFALEATPPTAQPALKPLTNEQIDAAIKAWFETDIVAGRQPFTKRMRAAFAAAHGIKGDA